MFSIGFFELLLVAIVGLLVVGPERLPGAVREATAWVNYFRRYAHEVRQDIEEQIDDVENHAMLASMRDGRKLLDDVQRDLQQSISAEPKGTTGTTGTTGTIGTIGTGDGIDSPSVQKVAES